MVMQSPQHHLRHAKLTLQGTRARHFIPTPGWHIFLQDLIQGNTLQKHKMHMNLKMRQPGVGVSCLLGEVCNGMHHRLNKGLR